MSVGHFHFLFGKCIFSSVHFLNNCLLLMLSCMFSLYMLNINIIGPIICKYFLLVSRLHFHFISGFLCWIKACKFNQVSFVYLFIFLFPLLQETGPKENVAAFYFKECSVYVFLLEVRSTNFEFILVYGVKNVLISSHKMKHLLYGFQQWQIPGFDI